jgi:hypothetical protein
VAWWDAYELIGLVDMVADEGENDGSERASVVADLRTSSVAGLGATVGLVSLTGGRAFVEATGDGDMALWIVLGSCRAEYPSSPVRKSCFVSEPGLGRGLDPLTPSWLQPSDCPPPESMRSASGRAALMSFIPAPVTCCEREPPIGWLPSFASLVVADAKFVPSEWDDEGPVRWWTNDCVLAVFARGVGRLISGDAGCTVGGAGWLALCGDTSRVYRRAGWGACGGGLIESNVSKLGNRSSNEGDFCGSWGFDGGRGEGCLDVEAASEGANESPNPDDMVGEKDVPHVVGEGTAWDVAVVEEAPPSPSGFQRADTFDFAEAAVFVGSIMSANPSKGTGDLDSGGGLDELEVFVGRSFAVELEDDGRKSGVADDCETDVFGWNDRVGS